MTDEPAGRPAADPLGVLWLALPESRPGRELFWQSQMPDARVAAVGERSTGDPVPFLLRPYRRATRRFIEAGALAWFKGLDTVTPDALGWTPDWVASLELCALVTGQATSLAHRLGTRQAVFTWGNDYRNPIYRLPLYHQITERALKADLFVCLIEAAADHCMALGAPEERCAVVLPPLDTELFSPAEQPQDEPVAIFSSPLAENKGIDRVLDAFDVVRRKIPEARLRVIGRGPMEGLVRERAAESGGAVELLGPRDRRGVADELRGSAVLVTAPRHTKVWNEQFGLAYVEAMACGIPVVTTVCGTNHEAVGEPNLRVDDTVEDIADALYTFLSDPALRRRVGVVNRATAVERFEFHQQIAKLRAAFDRVS